MKKISALALMFVLFVLLPLSAQTPPDPKTLTRIESLLAKAGKAADKKDVDKALDLIDKALQLKADYAPALFQKARLLGGRDRAQAVSLLEQAVGADSSFLPAVKALALTHYQDARQVAANDFAAAAGHYEQAAAVNNLVAADQGLYVESLFNAGTLRFQAGDVKAAVPHFEKLTALPEPANDEQKNTVRLSHYMLGMAQEKGGHIEPAQQAFRRFIELSAALPQDPFLPVARFLLAESLMNELNAKVEKINQDAEPDKAVRIAALAREKVEIVDLLAGAMAQKPEIVEASRMYLGNYHYLAGNVDKAIETYETLIRDFAASDQIGSYQDFLKGIKAEKAKQVQAAGKSSKKK